MLTDHVDATLLPSAAWSSELPHAARDTGPYDAPVRTRLHPLMHTPVYRDPADPEPFAALPPNVVGMLPTWVPMIDAVPGWALVLLPCRPDGAAGWVRLNERVLLVPLHTEIRIDVAEKTLMMLQSGRTRTWAIGVGKPATPTPKVRTFVAGQLRPSTGLVDRVLMLGVHRPTHLLYSTGIDAVGIHTWPGCHAAMSASDGSVLVPEDAITELCAAATAGTAVLIH